MDKLQLELHQQLQDIKHLTKQEVFQTLPDNLDWLNPKNWFDGLNLRMWVFGATGCLLIIIMLCVLRCIYKLFSHLLFTGLFGVVIFADTGEEVTEYIKGGYLQCKRRNGRKGFVPYLGGLAQILGR